MLVSDSNEEGRQYIEDIIDKGERKSRSTSYPNNLEKS
jgi:hypothetical protein